MTRLQESHILNYGSKIGLAERQGRAVQYRPSEVSHENTEQKHLDFGCRISCGDVNRGSASRRSGAPRPFQARAASIRKPFGAAQEQFTAIGAGQGEYDPDSTTAHKHGEGRAVLAKCAQNYAGSVESCTEYRPRAVKACVRGLGFSYALVL